MSNLQTLLQNPFMLNMDMDLVACSKAGEQHWVTSPADGVSRVHLEREAEESGHTTSFVKFAPGASFPTHTHLQGEEIYVLDGVFSDQFGDYPAGSYLRNPPGSSHRPFTREGCTLFVKLEQFKPGDTAQRVIRPEDQHWRAGIGNLRVLPLHDYETESTALVFWPAHEVFQPHRHWGGEEIVVLSGTFFDEHGEYPQGSWIRSPHLSQHSPFVGADDTLILVKVGHLGQTRVDTPV